MTSISKIKKEIINKLNASILLRDFDVLPEFAQTRRTALIKPILTVGINSVDIVPAGLGGYFGSNENNEHYEGAWADITLGFNCYSDASNKTQDQQDIFELLAQELLNLGIGITQIKSSPIKAVNGPFTVSLSATAQFQTLVAASKPVPFVKDFILKRSDFD